MPRLGAAIRRPSTMSLLGPRYAPAEIERHSFRACWPDRTHPSPVLLRHRSLMGTSMRAVPTPGGAAGVGRLASRGALRRAVRSRGTQPRHHRRTIRQGHSAPGKDRISLGEVLVEMIHEYARHLGPPTCCVSGSTDASASTPFSTPQGRPDVRRALGRSVASPETAVLPRCGTMIVPSRGRTWARNMSIARSSWTGPAVAARFIGELLVGEAHLHRGPEIEIRGVDDAEAGEHSRQVGEGRLGEIHRRFGRNEVRDRPLEQQLVAHGVCHAERREPGGASAEDLLRVAIAIEAAHPRVELPVPSGEQGVVDVELRGEVLVEGRGVQADSGPEVAHGQPGEARLVDERVCRLDDLVDERLVSSRSGARLGCAQTTNGGWASSLPAMTRARCARRPRLNMACCRAVSTSRTARSNGLER